MPSEEHASSEPPPAWFWLLSFSGPAVLLQLNFKNEEIMSDKSSRPAARFTLALDTWAVLLALALAAAVRFDLLKKVPW